MEKKQYRTEVQIFGTTYIIRGDEEPDYIISLAKYVDEKMKALTAKGQTLSTHKLAVLTALNIADELFKERESARQKIASLIKKIDEILKKLSS